ncbi:MAG: TIGR00730 family Rossman fold protein [Bacteroidota bacterium]
MQSIAIYCGSSPGFNDQYRQQAGLLGKKLAERGSRVVYGGGKVGLMGAVADGALAAGGAVVGVIPDFMIPKEVAHQGLTELIITDSMQTRKLEMHELSDGIITLPGGYGTMEELFEMVTWAQLGLHAKPIGILNINGYYDSLLLMLDKMVEEGFLRLSNREAVLSATTIDELLFKMEAFDPGYVEKWMGDGQT